MSKQVYFNNPQYRTFLVGANTSVIVAGRRTGKTDSIGAPFVLRNMQRMPGSTGAIVVPTFKHGLTNTIPALLAAWARWGYKRDLHYVIGKKPPKWFKTPIIEPASYEHVLTFYNGACAVLISQDRPGSANGLTLSWILADEAKFLDHQKLKDEVFPANGGIKSHFGKHSFNHSMMVLSDMPVSKKGSWFLGYREKMDPELIATIEATVCHIYDVKARIRELRQRGAEPPDYLRSYLRQLDRKLNAMRSVAVYYKEYSSIENLQLLGENYIRQMKRDLTPLTFQTSILCRRIGLAKDGFYSSMRESHMYDASDFDFLDTIGFIDDARSIANESRADADVNPNAPLCIGMDYNARINWLVAAQPSGQRLNVVKSFYVKYERKIPALISDFCHYYRNHRCKRVIFYYDSTALRGNYAVSEVDFFFVIRETFRKFGWDFVPVYLGNPMHHHQKYLLINEGFDRRNALIPYFNRQNNEDLLLAIRTAGVSVGRLGFSKDKSGEKYAESEEDRLEHRTDGTDAFDTVYIGCLTKPYSTSSTITITGIA